MRPDSSVLAISSMSVSEIMCAHTDERPFRVAFVCTGNRARSPFAAALLRHRTRSLPVSVQSFGVLDLGPVPALPEAVWAAGMLGVDLTGHRARTLRGADLGDADLVLGFEHFHVASAVVEGGAARAQAFLLTELAELLEEVRAPSGSMVTAHSVMSLVRAARPGVSSSHRPVADPLGGSKEEFLSIFEDISVLLEASSGRLFGAASARAEP